MNELNALQASLNVRHSIKDYWNSGKMLSFKSLSFQTDAILNVIHLETDGKID